jgi:branched-chain amino acid transport system substrate-binding protein
MIGKGRCQFIFSGSNQKIPFDIVHVLCLNHKVNLLLSSIIVVSSLIATPSSPHAQPIKVGIVLPLTGRFSAYGNDCLAGMRLAASQGNACSLIVEDNGGNKARTRESLKRLSTQGVSLIVGPLISENAMKAAYYIDSLNVPLILPATTHRIAAKLSSLVFRLCYSDEFQTMVMAEFAHFVLGKKRPALFVDNTSLYSIELSDVLAKALQEIGVPIVVTKSYDSQEIDFRQDLLKMADANPDCIFVPGYNEQVRLIMDQASELGMRIPLIGWDTWDSWTLLGAAGTKNHESFYCTHFSKEDPRVEGFRKAYFNRVGSEPTAFSALGYDAVKLIAYLRLENPEPETAFNKLNRVTDFQGVTGTIDLSRGGNPIKGATIIKLHRGKLSVEQRTEGRE